MVVGSWRQSPFGAFADVMMETAEGERILLAPSEQIAEFVSETYTFDRLELGPVEVIHERDGFTVRSTALSISAHLGGPAPFDWLLRMVPPASGDLTGVVARDRPDGRSAGPGRAHRGQRGARSARVLRCPAHPTHSLRAHRVSRGRPRRPYPAGTPGTLRLLVRAADTAARLGDDDDRTALADVARGGPARRPAGEHAATEERAL